MYSNEYKLSSKRYECASCHVENRMYQICTGKGSASYVDPNFDEHKGGYHPYHGQHFASFTWLVLMCTICEEINFFELREFEDHVYIIGTDPIGEEIEIQPIETKRLYPFIDSSIPLPHTDLSDELRDTYLEALKVYPISPRSSCALLRLLIQKLCKEFGGRGKKINDDIAFLVANGLPEQIQQSLDIIRVIGNNAVHPGTIDLDDNPEIAKDLFELVNLIVEEIGLPKRQADNKRKIAEKYQELPENARRGIQSRDGKA